MKCRKVHTQAVCFLSHLVLLLSGCLVLTEANKINNARNLSVRRVAVNYGLGQRTGWTGGHLQPSADTYSPRQTRSAPPRDPFRVTEATTAHVSAPLPPPSGRRYHHSCGAPIKCPPAAPARAVRSEPPRRRQHGRAH